MALEDVFEELLKEPQKFREWVELQDEDETFCPGDSCGCPLYEFLNQSLHGKGIRPGYLEVWVDKIGFKEGGSTEDRLREWTFLHWAAIFSHEDEALANDGIAWIYPKKVLSMLDDIEQSLRPSDNR